MNKKRFKKIYREITNVCNLKCDFCIKSNRKKEYMTTQNFIKILEKILPYTDYIYLHVKGEPLLHPNLFEILNVAYNKKLQVNITTNGTLLDKQLDVLSNSKSLRQINISLHSIGQNKRIDIEKEKYLNTAIMCANKIHNSNGAYISYRIWDMNDIEKDKTYIIQTLEKAYNINNIYNH